MTLPVSGPISFNAINVELNVAGTTTANINQASYRALAGVPSGTISLSNFYGKTNEFLFTIGSNQTNANLRTLAVNAGWNQISRVVATINGGVYVSANSTGTPGLTVDGSFPNGVELVNNGFIIGMGGNGGAGADGMTGESVTSGNPGSAGGPALVASVGVAVRNNGTIGGGGGGGGGGGQLHEYDYGWGGGGGGGGQTGTTNSSGGAAGNFYGQRSRDSTAGGAGTSGSAGGGGVGAAAPNFSFRGGDGGAGGSWGANGAAGQDRVGPGFSPPSSGGSGGAAGAAVNGNGNITWLATGTRLGPIS